MLFYRTVVMSAITDQVEPLLKNVIQQVLTQRIGPDWYELEGNAIMEQYEDFDKIKNLISRKVQPLEVMDLTALFFLLLPYSKDPQVVFKTDLAAEVAEYFHLDEAYCKRKLRRLREIRNNAIHDDCDKDEILAHTICDDSGLFDDADGDDGENVMLDPEFLLSGVQEKKWLNDIEKILKNFRPSFQLEAYRIQLNQLIAEKKNEDSDISAYADLISETEAIRGECLRIHRMDFLEAPLGYPLSGAAPWADVVTDLEDLPWPSQQHAAEEPAEVKAPAVFRPAAPNSFTSPVSSSSAQQSGGGGGTFSKLLRFFEKKN